MLTPVVRSSPAKGLQNILLAVPALVAQDWKILIGRLVDAPDKQVVIMNSGGLAGESNIAIDYPRIQIIVRGPKGSGGQEEAWSRLDMIKQVLVGIPSAPALMPTLTSCVPVGEITYAGYDDSGRPLYTQNLQLIVSYDSSGHREA